LVTPIASLPSATYETLERPASFSAKLKRLEGLSAEETKLQRRKEELPKAKLNLEGEAKYLN